MPTTVADAANGWAIDDEVVQLREWGTQRVHPVPTPGGASTIGTGERCAVRLVDPSGRLSREHARLARDVRGCSICDLASTNGTRLDGVRHAEFALAPGAEVGLGGITLIAESRRLIALRALIARLIGWRAERAAEVDRALRAVRMAAACRSALVVSGEGDLVPIVEALHRCVLGDDRPFVACDPRRRAFAASVRSPRSQPTGLRTLAAAAGGTACFAAQRLPRDFGEVVAALRDPAVAVQLAVHSGTPPRLGFGELIELPPLAERTGELDRIIDEYAADAIAQLATAATFTPRDRDWVRDHAAGSLPEIEKATRRLIAIRHHGTIAGAARGLGMSHVGLARWLLRRRSQS